MKKFGFIILLLVSGFQVFAQVAAKYPYIKTWRISERFAVADTIPVDTVHLNFTERNPIDRFSIANSYNGNLGSPIQSKIYFDRPANTDFIFSNAYFPYTMNVQNATFYNTKTPYSNLNYITGGTTYRKEDNIKFIFTANANKKLNFGTTLDYIYAVGEYRNQSVRRFAGSLFGSYNGTHYSATGLVATNNHSNFENGGIASTKDGINPTGVATKDIPVNITGYSNFRQNIFYYNHQYSIGFERPVRVSKDSMGVEYVPVTRFAHTFKLEDSRKRYFENNVITGFYTNTYGVEAQTNDTSALQTLTNNFSISMAEEFNKWMKFGLSAFIENEVQRYTYDNYNLLNLEFKSSTKLGGVLSKQQGRRFRYNALGEMTFVGYKAGDFVLQGNIGGFFKLWNDSISMVASGFVRSDEPSWILQHYQSNHFRWDNDFSKVYRTHVGGTFSLPTRLFSLNVSIENITRMIYFNKLALPEQNDGNVQVVAANLKQDFHFGKFALENNAVYQVSSQKDVLPLPMLALFHNLYFHDIWFHVLSVQLGATVRYHTAYHAPAYMPATGQFYSQSETLIGNYPVANIYANFHLKRTRFFLEYYHINQKFMDGAYYSMPGYPLNPKVTKLGISWNFYD
ncbi:MAG TPA: putative porin [Paludibacter sp.]|nr:putative porin [Paludibacter sp.]